MDSAIDMWFNQFIENDVIAIDKLFEGRVFMGALHPNETSEIIYRIFHTKEDYMKNKLDNAIKQWFINKWCTIPINMPLNRWIGILEQAFFVVYRLKLSGCYNWLVLSHKSDDTNIWFQKMRFIKNIDIKVYLLNMLDLYKKTELNLEK